MTLVIREAAAALRRTPILAVMTSIVIAVSLALCGMFAMLTKRANDSLEEFRSKLVIEAFFDPSVSSADAELATGEKIKSISGITSLRSISKEDALAEYVKSSGEDVERILGYNPLPASLRLTFANLTSQNAQAIRKQLLAVEGMNDVLYDEKSLLALEKRSQTLYLLALALGGVLVVVSLTVVTSTIRLAIEARHDTIHAMQLLGAGRMSIIFPYLIEGGFSGIVGGLLAGGLILLFHFLVIPAIAPELATNISEAKHYAVIFGTGTVLGLAIGTIGSFSAVWRSSRIR
ncbi:MAG: permease-like cell division protein FtsX [Bacteroidota bacterium]|nr:permease-like cell division protein FtsX [Bacteroidota bacterium]